MSDRTGPSVAFYCNGIYDPIIPVLHFKSEGTIAIEEPFGTTIDPVPQYTGPVLLISGDHDAAVCGINTQGSCLQAADSTVAKTKSFFPEAACFDYFLPNQSRHSINFHYTATQTFKAIRDWIDLKLGGGPGNNTCNTSLNATTSSNMTTTPSPPKAYVAGSAVNLVSVGAVAAGLVAVLCLT